MGFELFHHFPILWLCKYHCIYDIKKLMKFYVNIPLTINILVFCLIPSIEQSILFCWYFWITFLHFHVQRGMGILMGTLSGVKYIFLIWFLRGNDHSFFMILTIYFFSYSKILFPLLSMNSRYPQKILIQMTLVMIKDNSGTPFHDATHWFKKDYPILFWTFVNSSIFG